MMVLRRIALATAIFVAASVAIWSTWLGWDTVLTPTVRVAVACPLIWWWLVARRPRGGLLRAALAGGLIGFVTQALPDFLALLWDSHVHGPAGEGGIALGIAAAFYIIITLWATPIAAVIGALTTGVQALIERPRS